MRQERVLCVENGEGFMMELFADREDRGVQVGGGWVDGGGVEALAAGGVAAG